MVTREKDGDKEKDPQKRQQWEPVWDSYRVHTWTRAGATHFSLRGPSTHPSTSSIQKLSIRAMLACLEPYRKLLIGEAWQLGAYARGGKGTGHKVAVKVTDLEYSGHNWVEKLVHVVGFERS